MGVESHELAVPAEVQREARELTRLANDLFRGIGELTISTQDEFEMAGDWSKKLARLRRDTEAAKKARRDPYTSLLNAISAEYETPLRVLKTAEESLDGGLKKWIMAERKRQEDLNRRREDERRQEVLRAAKLAEEARLAEAEAVATHQAAVAADDQDLHETTCELVEAADQKAAESAEHFERAAELAIPVQSYQPVKGIHTRETWFARVVDESLVPRDHLVPDFEKLDRLAKAIKGPSNIPGVEFYAETTVIKKTR